MNSVEFCHTIPDQHQTMSSFAYDEEDPDNHVPEPAPVAVTPAVSAAAAAAAYAFDADDDEDDAPGRAGTSLAGTNQHTRRRCAVDGCGKQSQGKRCNGMCAAHYKRYGDPFTAMAAAATPGGEGAMAMAAATMADMNLDNLSVSGAAFGGNDGGGAKSKTKTSGAKGTKRGGGNGTGQKRKKPLCSVEGCVKQSQGRHRNFMCAAHFREKFGPSAAAAAAAAAAGGGGGGGGATRRRKNVRHNGRSSNHPLCAIDGCPKQSQGGRCNYMCAKHFKQYGASDEKGDDGEDVDEVEEDEYESSESDDEDEFAYERNNGYYPFSPGTNGYAPFVHGVDNDAARGIAASLAADGYDPSLMHSLEDHCHQQQEGTQMQPQHQHEMPPLIGYGYGLGREVVSVTAGMSQMPDEDAAAAAVAASAVQISREAAAAAAAAAAPSTPGERERRADTSASNNLSVSAGTGSVGDRARSIVNAMEAGHRGSHWDQIQSIHNGRSGRNQDPVDRRRRAEMEMERARQLAAQQPQQEGVQTPTDVVGGVDAGRIDNDGDGTRDDANNLNCGSDSSSDGNNDNGQLPPSPLTPRYASGILSGIPMEVQCRNPINHAGNAHNSATSVQPLPRLNSPDLFLAEFVLAKDGKDDAMQDFDMTSPGPRAATSGATAASSGPAEGAPRQHMKVDEHFEKDKEHGGCWEFGGDESGDDLGDVLGSPLHEGPPSLEDTAAPQRAKLSSRNKKKQGRPSTLPEIDDQNDTNSSSEEAHGSDNTGKSSSKNQSDGPDTIATSQTMSRPSPKRMSAANEATAVKSHFERVQGRRKQDPFAFDQTSGVNTAPDPKTSKPPASLRRYGSPGRAQDEQMLSPGRRRKRRLDKQIGHAKKVAASPAASVLGSASFASPSSSVHEEEREHVDFAERLSCVNLTTEVCAYYCWWLCLCPLRNFLLTVSLFSFPATVQT